MSEDREARDGPPDGEFPLAKIRESKPPLADAFKQFHTRFWWVTALCLLVAIALTLSATLGKGDRIRVRFLEGHGIKPGDALRYRGTDVGRVVGVELGENLSRVHVQIELDPSAAALAREGSRFWIERPRVSLSRVRGLETVVGAKYLGVLPGPEDAERADVFDGVETPPAMAESTVTEITIRFKEGHGLIAGDLVKHRGIVVGEVTSVHLNAQLTGVEVRVLLVESASRLARAGSQFWIERPEVSLTGIQGLETVVGGRYIAVLPGPSEANPLTAFDGIDRAPASVDRPEGGLEIVLESASRSGLARGSAVAYRGVRIGHIVSVGLSTDSVSVEARAFVRPEFVDLICEDTKFWNTSGIKTKLGWTGVRLEVDTLATIAAGGVALATPDSPGKPVSTGHRFPLHDDPEDSWLTFEPRIPMGSSLLPKGLSLPQPLRAALHWSESTLGFKRSKQREGWVLPLDGGRLLGPAELLSTVGSAVGGSVHLEVAGEKIPVTDEASQRLGMFAVYRTGEPSFPLARPWPLARIRNPEGPEDCVLIGDPQSEGVPLSIGRLTPSDRAWDVDPSLSLAPDWHGAAVLSRQDGSLIGILLVDKGCARIVPVNKEAIENGPGETKSAVPH